MMPGHKIINKRHATVTSIVAVSRIKSARNVMNSTHRVLFVLNHVMQKKQQNTRLVGAGRRGENHPAASAN